MSDAGAGAGARVPYAGVVTRAIALAVDAALVQGILLAAGAAIALVASLVGGLHFDAVAKAVAAGTWVVVVTGWFVLFWTTAGQTPGMQLLGLRLVGPDGRPPGLARSFIRVAGLAAAIAPAFAGFLPVLVDDRRRGLQDFVARTVVLYAGEDAPEALRAAAPSSERYGRGDAAHAPRRRWFVRQV